MKLRSVARAGRSRDDESEDEAVADCEPTCESAQLRSVNLGRACEEVRAEGLPVGVEANGGLLEAEPASGQGIPRLEDRLFRGEEEPVPAQAVGPAGRPCKLRETTDPSRDAVGERLVRLGVDAERCVLRAPRDDGGAIAAAVRDASDDTVRPQRLPVRAPADRHLWMIERGERATCAAASGGELSNSPFRGVAKSRTLFGMERVQGRRLGGLDTDDPAGKEHLDQAAAGESRRNRFCTVGRVVTTQCRHV